MIRYSNFSIGKDRATIHNSQHNDRTKKASYIISRNKKHFWVDVNSKDVEKSLKILLKKITKNRKAVGKKKISRQTHIMKEFVVNLDRQHRPEVMHDIANYIKKYNFTILQLSMHGDEGVFVKKLNVLAKNWNLNDYDYDSDKKKWLDKNEKVVLDIIVYQPNINIFWDEKSEKWYHDKAYRKDLNMSTVKKKINFHGHILVLNLDEKGNSIARTLRPHLSQMQKDIARITQMPTKPTSNNRKGQKHMDYKNSAALSAKEDEMKRKKIVLYNQNQKLMKQFGRLDPKILQTKNLNEKYELIQSSMKNFLGWKKFAIEQYKLLGFPYTSGDKINIKEAAKAISNNLNARENFIKEAYDIFGISSNSSYEDAIKQLKELVPKEPKICSIL